MGLEFVPAIDENSMGVDNTPCIHVVESHMENLQIVNRPAQALYPLVLHNNDQAALTYTFQCPSSEGNETGIKIIVKYMGKSYYISNFIWYSESNCLMDMYCWVYVLISPIDP